VPKTTAPPSPPAIPALDLRPTGRLPHLVTAAAKATREGER
jgi:hypothetical protein